MSPTSYQAALPRDRCLSNPMYVRTPVKVSPKEPVSLFAVNLWQAVRRGGGGSGGGVLLYSAMDRVLEELVRRTAAGEAVALCTGVAARGSTPQSAGARMLLLGDGKTIGTLGGGCVEAEVRVQAIKVLQARSAQLLTFKLDHDYGWDDGLICGGAMGIFVQTLRGASAAGGDRAGGGGAPRRPAPTPTDPAHLGGGEGHFKQDAAP